MKAKKGLQIMNSVKNELKFKKEMAKIKPLTHQLELEEPQKPTKFIEDTDMLFAETGRILPLGVCFNCD